MAVSSIFTVVLNTVFLKQSLPVNFFSINFLVTITFLAI